MDLATPGGGLVGSIGVTVLLVRAEPSGVALALQVATSIHYLTWGLPVAAAIVPCWCVFSFERSRVAAPT